MSSLKTHAVRRHITHKLRPQNGLWCHSLLHPLHHSRQHICSSIECNALGRSLALAEAPCASSTVTMVHAGNPEEAKPAVELAVRLAHADGETVVEGFGVEAGDLVVGSAVVGDYLAAGMLEGGEGSGPCTDVGRIERFGGGSVCGAEGGWLPRRVGVDDVFEPILGDQ